MLAASSAIRFAGRPILVRTVIPRPAAAAAYRLERLGVAGKTLTSWASCISLARCCRAWWPDLAGTHKRERMRFSVPLPRDIMRQLGQQT
jgi:hypothetical protein